MWKVSRNIMKRLHVFINRCLRRILKIRWLEKISNNKLLKITNQEQIESEIKKMEVDWTHSKKK